MRNARGADVCAVVLPDDGPVVHADAGADAHPDVRPDPVADADADVHPDPVAVPGAVGRAVTQETEVPSPILK